MSFFLQSVAVIHSRHGNKEVVRLIGPVVALGPRGTALPVATCRRISRLKTSLFRFLARPGPVGVPSRPPRPLALVIPPPRAFAALSMTRSPSRSVREALRRFAIAPRLLVKPSTGVPRLVVTPVVMLLVLRLS